MILLDKIVPIDDISQSLTICKIYKSNTPSVRDLVININLILLFKGVKSRYNPGYFFLTRTELDNAIGLYISNKKEGENIFGEIDKWNITNITDLSGLFLNKTTFNENIGNWDTRRVTTMQEMFKGASSFNQNISSWDISSVTTVQSMFEGTSTFNQDLSNWDVSGIVFTNMFLNATSMITANKPNGYTGP